MGSPQTTRILVVGMAFVTVLPMARWIANRKIDFFEIIYPIGLSYFVYFVLSSRDPFSEANPGFLWLSDEHINRALLYTQLGFLALLAGYYSRLPPLLVKRLPRFRSPFPSGRVHTIIYLLFAVGLAVRLYLLILGVGTWSTKMEELEGGSSLPGTTTTITYFQNLATLAYVLATAYFFSGERTRALGVVLWGIMVPFECLWVFLQGSKSLFIPILCAPFIAYNYLRARVSLRQVVLPMALLVFVIFPVISEYRNFAQEYPIQLQTLPAYLPKIVGRLVQEIVSPESESYVGRGPEMVSERASGLLPVANTIQYVEENELLRGETLWQVPLVALPSVLVPMKYKLIEPTGDIYREDVSGLYESTSGIAIMQTGEFYLNFGLAGILICMLLQGILYRCWQLYWVQWGTPLAMAIFIVGWRNLILIEFPFASAYGLILRELMLMLLISWMIRLGEPTEEGLLPKAAA